MRLIKGVKAYIKAYRKSVQTTPVRPFNFYLLAETPNIIYTTTNRHLANVFYMSSQLSERAVHFIVGFSWDFSSRERSVRLVREYRLHQRRYPRHSLVFICNAQAEVDALSQKGLPTLFVNKNAFHDLSEYWLDAAAATKRFDAIMNARIAPFKRVELAAEVENLALITSPSEAERDHTYYRQMREVLAHATWLNYTDDSTYRRLDSTGVAEALLQSRVGLILSAVEGQCQASIEYLLAGLPVVSTPSRGGRDTFFDEEYVAIVDPHPKAVREGVQHLISQNLDPAYIRNKTIATINEHRDRFCTYINECVAAAGEEAKTTETWFAHWENKLKFFCEPASFKDIIDSAYFSHKPFYHNEAELRHHYPRLLRPAQETIAQSDMAARQMCDL